MVKIAVGQCRKAIDQRSSDIFGMKYSKDIRCKMESNFKVIEHQKLSIFV